MALRSILTTLRDWAALLGAVAMVLFLTFVPQHAGPAAASTASSPHVVEGVWPSRSAALDGSAIR